MLHVIENDLRQIRGIRDKRMEVIMAVIENHLSKWEVKNDAERWNEKKEKVS